MSNHLQLASAQDIAVFVTPELARKWLSVNGLNRPLSKKLVDLYASVMKRGAWKFTGETIVFGDDGRLLDGQHRLSAIVESGVPARMAVIGGVHDPEDVFKTMGSGKPRSNPDILAISGEVNASDLSSAVRSFYQYHCGPNTRQANLKVAPDIMFSVLEEHPGLKIWCANASKLKKCGFSQAIMSTVLFGMSQVDQEKAVSFYQECESGANLSSESPAFILRNRLSYRPRTGTIPRIILFAMCIKAANAYLLSKTLMRLTWLSEKEDFPEIVGYPMDSSLFMYRKE